MVRLLIVISHFENDQVKLSFPGFGYTSNYTPNQPTGEMHKKRGQRLFAYALTLTHNLRRGIIQAHIRSQGSAANQQDNKVQAFETHGGAIWIRRRKTGSGTF